MSKNIVRVLWTGGWDSSFRVLQLSRGGAYEGDYEIQPVYVYGDERPSEEIEIRTMNKLRDMINARPDTKVQVLPIRMIDEKDILENTEVIAAYRRMREKIKLGTQYKWLGCLAAAEPGMEIGAILPDGEFSGLREAIESNGGFVPCKSVYKLDIEHSDEDCRLLFGNYTYPLVYTKEREMLRLAKEWHAEDIMANIWFCYTPINGKPCGLCRPCEQKMEGNMQILLPARARLRFKMIKPMSKLFGTSRAKRLLRQIGNFPNMHSKS